MYRRNIKVLILGGGNAARRYVESFIFYDDMKMTLVSFSLRNKTEALAQEFNIECFPFFMLTRENINRYDCICVCVPLNAKYKIIHHLIEKLGYVNSILIEKPLTLDFIELIGYNNLLRGREKIGIAYLRRYIDDYIEFPCYNYYDIQYSTFTDNLIYNLEHMLPHLLEWIIRENHMVELTHLSGRAIYGKIDGKKARIEFCTSDNGRIIINGNSINNPDHIIANRKMLFKVLIANQKELLDLLKISSVILIQIENLKNKIRFDGSD